MSRFSAARWRKAFLRFLRVLARPVRRAQGRGGIVIESYRGYGSTREVFLIGRVFRQTHPDRDADPSDFRTHLRDILRRIRRRKIAGAKLTVRFGSMEERVETDPDGYFRAHLRLAEPPLATDLWHAVDLRLDGEPPVTAEGRIFVPPPERRFAVISDIDDTVMRTGVANKAVMLWRLFVASAGSRIAFPGAAALYRALYLGAGGAEHNPMLYVSRAPWGIYDVLTTFFRAHGIPEGPLLFLREWGLSWTHPLPRRAVDHKRILIDHMMGLYADLPFVLIGDSGQHDPEVYARIVESYPGRVKAVYIRDVSRRVIGRAAEIARLAEAVATAGSHLVLAEDSLAMARHAASIGLIAPEALAAVAEEKSIAALAASGDAAAPVGAEP